MKSIVLSALIVLGGIAPVLAQTATPRVDARQDNQQKRIDAGVAKGQLTPKEAANLQRGQARVQRIEDKAKSDGVVTGRERARLNRAQNVESGKIAKKRHNARTN